MVLICALVFMFYRYIKKKIRLDRAFIWRHFYPRYKKELEEFYWKIHIQVKIFKESLKFNDLYIFIENTKELKVDDDNGNQVFKIKQLRYAILIYCLNFLWYI
jgi:hypothetical protein